jgi:hypothetical protein
VTLRVLVSTKLVEALAEPNNTVVPFTNPLPRIVTVVPPDAGPELGVSVPMLSGS